MKRTSQDYTRLIRNADDYVAWFQFADEAMQFRCDMDARLAHLFSLGKSSNGQACGSIQTVYMAVSPLRA